MDLNEILRMFMKSLSFVFNPYYFVWSPRDFNKILWITIEWNLMLHNHMINKSAMDLYEIQQILYGII